MPTEKLFSQKNLVQVEGLEKLYSQPSGEEVPVLKNLCLEVKEGESLAIVGPSGAGKSTLLHLLGGLDHFSKGKICILGEDLQKLSESQLARFRSLNLSYIFQFHHLLMDFTALENVMMPLWIQAKKKLPLEAKAKEWLAEVGLSHRTQHLPSQLSGGEQQRLAIARAMITNPKILLADEPSGNLDEENTEKIRSLLLKLNQTHRKTLLLVTHNPSLAKSMQRTLKLYQGTLHPQILQKNP